VCYLPCPFPSKNIIRMNRISGSIQSCTKQLNLINIKQSRSSIERGREVETVTDSRSGGSAALDSGDTTEEDESRAMRLGNSNGSQGVATSRTRSIIIRTPVSLQGPIGRSWVKPWLGSHFPPPLLY